MRNSFASELRAIAQTDSRVLLLSGDIGNRLFDDFKKDYPNRFVNCGVAEQNMISVAAGLAISGFRPIAYTIAQFITSRCFEQIRTDVCYHKSPVIIVGVGSGLSYSGLGPTHHCLEDLALMRSLPGMNVYCPGDPAEVKMCLKLALNHEGPSYLRLGKKGEPSVFSNDHRIVDNDFTECMAGDDCCILTTGNIVAEVVEAGKILSNEKINVSVFHIAVLKPFNEARILELAKTHRKIVTIEEHSVIGGLGSAVSAVLAAQTGCSVSLHTFGVNDMFFTEAGERAYALEELGLSAQRIADRVKQLVNQERCN